MVSNNQSGPSRLRRRARHPEVCTASANASEAETFKKPLPVVNLAANTSEMEIFKKPLPAAVTLIMKDWGSREKSGSGQGSFSTQNQTVANKGVS